MVKTPDLVPQKPAAMGYHALRKEQKMIFVIQVGSAESIPPHGKNPFLYWAEH